MMKMIILGFVASLLTLSQLNAASADSASGTNTTEPSPVGDSQSMNLAETSTTNALPEGVKHPTVKSVNWGDTNLAVNVRLVERHTETGNYSIFVSGGENLTVLYTTSRNSGKHEVRELIPEATSSINGMREYNFYHRFSRSTIWMRLDFENGGNRIDALARSFYGELDSAVDYINTKPFPWNLEFQYSETPPNPGAGAAKISLSLTVHTNCFYEWSYAVGAFRDQKGSSTYGRGRLSEKLRAPLHNVIDKSRLLAINTNFVSTGMTGDEDGWGGAITLASDKQKRTIAFATQGPLDKDGEALSQVAWHLKNFVLNEKDRKLQTPGVTNLSEITSQIEPRGPDITKQVSAVVCDGIRVLSATHDVRPTYHDGPSRITANLRLNTAGQYTIHFQHPEGTNQPPISLVVGSPAENSATNTFKVYQGCPASITNRQNDTLLLEWRGLPGRGPRQNGWFFKGIKKE